MSKVNIKELMKPDFWKMISDISWGDKTTSAASASSYILKHYPPYKANFFKNIAGDLANELTDAYLNKNHDKNVRYEVYIIAHEIVAQGSQIFAKYLKEPGLLTALIENANFDNLDNFFANALPTEDDYYTKNNSATE